MGKSRSPNRDKAFEIYKNNNGNIAPREIAKMLDESASNISSWKNQDKWGEKLDVGKAGKKRGAQKGNLNNLRHGMYCGAKRFNSQEFFKKYLPKVKENIIKDIEENDIHPIDIIWGMIVDGYSDLIRSSKIMHVKNSNDTTKILKKESNGENSSSKEYEIETALTKQATALKAKAVQMQTLNNLIRQYDEMIHDSLGLATEEQKLRIEKLRAEVSVLNGIGNEEQKLRIDKLKAEVSILNGGDKDNTKGNLDKLIEVFNKGPAK